MGAAGLVQTPNAHPAGGHPAAGEAGAGERRAVLGEEADGAGNGVRIPTMAPAGELCSRPCWSGTHGPPGKGIPEDRDRKAIRDRRPAPLRRALGQAWRKPLPST